MTAARKGFVGLDHDAAAAALDRAVGQHHLHRLDGAGQRDGLVGIGRDRNCRRKQLAGNTSAPASSEMFADSVSSPPRSGPSRRSTIVAVSPGKELAATIGITFAWHQA
ncbi:hypothetical protein Q3C01_43590 [Bradyrhizobium sp. UFLA05-109]